MSITVFRGQSVTKKDLVRFVLEHADRFEWSLQGFGMLRTYLDEGKNLRLHAWDSRFKVEGVDELHTHPWNFHSDVIAGRVVNTRFERKMIGKGFAIDGEGPFREQEILCGPGGCATDAEPAIVALKPLSGEMYSEGDNYSQLAHEIHRSSPLDGTVTIVRREFLDDDDHAFVYIPVGEEWVSAEPRGATAPEVEAITRNALMTWF